MKAAARRRQAEDLAEQLAEQKRSKERRRANDHGEADEDAKIRGEAAVQGAR